jgi:hypothetical protein
MFTEDLTAFFADFSVAATLAAVSVTSGVIADADYLEALGLNVVEGRGPAALAIASEVASVAQGQALVIATGPVAGTWNVVGVEPDGTGLVLMRLAQ